MSPSGRVRPDGDFPHVPRAFGKTKPRSGRSVSTCLWVLIAFALAAPLGVGAASSLLGMRLGVTSERTRVVLDMQSGSFTYRHSMSGDSVLLLHLDGVQESSSFRPAAKDGLVLGTTVTQDEGKGITIRLRLRPPAKAKIFKVAKGDGRPDRLVIDVTGGRGAPVNSEPSGVPTPDGSSAEVKPDPPSEPPNPSPVPSRRGPRIVVIDPGHGGNDPGATAKGLREKDVCLDVARRLAAHLNKSATAQGVLTRDADRLVPLRERYRFAEKKDADLFVSIHVNAAKSRAAHGAEVFFVSVGAATDVASRELARLENEADPDYVVQEDESLRNLPFAVNLRQSDTMMRSSHAAEVLLDLLVERRLAENRGVKQAGFAVLKSFQIPSVLVELGFISSVTDREKLKTPAHREKLAGALADGIVRYLETYAAQRPTDPSP